MILPTKGRVPPSDGTSHWRFQVAPGVMLRAQDHDGLVKLVFEYRLRNNIEPGDVVRDISNWYCAQFPKFCHPDPRPVKADPSIPPAPLPPSEPILNRVSRWASVMAHKMPRGGYSLVTLDVAEKRAAICVGCPSQDSQWRGGCGGCSATTLQILQALKALKKTTKDGSLGACKVMGWANTVSIWCDPSVIPANASEKSVMPDACWRKSLP
jgi:hypothetical protein